MAKSGFEIYCRACGCLMKKRSGKYGEFYGCTAYPHCKATTTTREASYEQEVWEKERFSKGS